MESAARVLRLVNRRRFALGGYAPGQQTQVFLRVLGRNEYHIMSAVLARGRHKRLKLSDENLDELIEGWVALFVRMWNAVSC